MRRGEVGWVGPLARKRHPGNTVYNNRCGERVWGRPEPVAGRGRVAVRAPRPGARRPSAPETQHNLSRAATGSTDQGQD